MSTSIGPITYGFFPEALAPAFSPVGFAGSGDFTDPAWGEEEGFPDEGTVSFCAQQAAAVQKSTKTSFRDTFLNPIRQNGKKEYTYVNGGESSKPVCIFPG
jgi:hypothetical protein